MFSLSDIKSGISALFSRDPTPDSLIAELSKKDRDFCDSLIQELWMACERVVRRQDKVLPLNHYIVCKRKKDSNGIDFKIISNRERWIGKDERDESKWSTLNLEALELDLDEEWRDDATLAIFAVKEKEIKKSTGETDYMVTLATGVELIEDDTFDVRPKTSSGFVKVPLNAIHIDEELERKQQRIFSLKKIVCKIVVPTVDQKLVEGESARKHLYVDYSGLELYNLIFDQIVDRNATQNSN